MKVDWLKGLCKALGAGLYTAASQMHGTAAAACLAFATAFTTLGAFLSDPARSVPAGALSKAAAPALAEVDDKAA